MFAAAPAMAAGSGMNAPATLSLPGSNWAGLYAGLFAGGAFAHSDVDTSADCTAAPGFPFVYFICSGVAGVEAAGTGGMSDIGVTGGLRVGYNWQINSAVFGFVADFGAFDVDASRTETQPVWTGYNATISSSVDADWLFTARARLGWALDDKFLAYATGGLAVTRLSASHSYFDTDTTPTGFGAGTWSDSALKAGWTLGAGAEWAFSQRWTASVEYLHVHFGAVDASGTVTSTSLPGYGSAISTSTDLSAETARVGVNYRFLSAVADGGRLTFGQEPSPAMNYWFEHVLNNTLSQPESPAIVTEDQVVTYRMLGLAIESAARRIVSLNIAEGGTVAVCVANPIRHVALCLALYRVGICSMSFEHSQPGISDSDVRGGHR